MQLPDLKQAINWLGTAPGKGLQSKKKWISVTFNTVNRDPGQASPYGNRELHSACYPWAGQLLGLLHVPWALPSRLCQPVTALRFTVWQSGPCFSCCFPQAAFSSTLHFFSKVPVFWNRHFPLISHHHSVRAFDNWMSKVTHDPDDPALKLQLISAEVSPRLNPCPQPFAESLTLGLQTGQSDGWSCKIETIGSQTRQASEPC